MNGIVRWRLQQPDATKGRERWAGARPDDGARDDASLDVHVGRPSTMGKKKTKAPPPDSTAAPDSAAALVTLETLTAGDGTTVPKLGDACTVHYEGTLLSDGTMFDSSRVKKVPFTFKLGGGGVIKGYDRGVSQMSVGQRAKLTIPSHAAYGSVGAVDKQNASGTGIIPPDADLNFDVELLAR